MCEAVHTTWYISGFHALPLGFFVSNDPEFRPAADANHEPPLRHRVWVDRYLHGIVGHAFEMHPAVLSVEFFQFARLSALQNDSTSEKPFLLQGRGHELCAPNFVGC
jgi:hypothetical protein